MSGSPFRALQLRPVQTARVCAEIIKRWGTGDDLLPVDNAASRSRVRQLLSSLKPGDALYRRDARLAAAMATDDSEAPEWRLHATDVLAAMPRPLPFATLYRLYQHFFAHSDLRHTLSLSFSALAGARPFSDAHAKDIFSDNPVDSLMVRAFRGRLAIAAINGEFLLQVSAPLTIEVARGCYGAALANPTGALEQPWLRAHSAAEAVAALQTQLTTDQERGAFLTALVRARGALQKKFIEVAGDAVLPRLFERITQKDMLGKPDDRPQLWSMDREVVNLVRRWLRYKLIGEFFDRVDVEPARRIFWQRATAVIEDIDEYTQCNAFAMKIGPLWFVEFGETGNACYPYLDETYQTMRRRWNRLTYPWNANPASLKDKELVYLPAEFIFWDSDERQYSVASGTLVHNPRWYEQWSPGWHRKFEAYIYTYCHAVLE